MEFTRSKTKELFAFLVDRHGASMTAKQICAVLFPEDTDDSKNTSYLRQLVLDLKNTLRSVGAENVLRHETPCYRVDTSLIKCDFGFRVSLRVMISPNFFAWVLGFGKDMRIVAPEAVRREMLERLRDTMEVYNEKIQ